ncbi:4Fe-4S dicluster domain-containing protein [Desulfobacula sp.]|nr:4Fe-4S dicluster domain-containing protein [Desulfobacula sp.]
MINQDEGRQTLADEIKASSGINFNACLHCKTCANGCPFLEGMDYAPNAVIRLIQFGMEEEALK